MLQLARQTDRLKLQLAADYEAIRPVLARQAQTIAAIETLGMLVNHPLPTNSWFVLFADADSYYNQRVLAPPTNAPSFTNQAAAAAARLTNAFVAEFSTALDAANARMVLSGMIDRFKTNALFRKVDILSTDQRRRLVKDGVLVPEGHYALSFTLHENDFLKPFLPAEEFRQLNVQFDRERTNTIRAAGSAPSRAPNR